MSFIQELVDASLEDSYLKKLLEKAEQIYGIYFFKRKNTIFFTDKEYQDILRFADILSRDEKYVGRNLAYKIISVLYPFFHNDNYYKFISNSVLTKLGNFPSLNLIMESDDSNRYNTVEVLLDKI